MRMGLRLKDNRISTVVAWRCSSIISALSVWACLALIATSSHAVETTANDNNAQIATKQGNSQQVAADDSASEKKDDKQDGSPAVSTAAQIAQLDLQIAEAEIKSKKFQDELSLVQQRLLDLNLQQKYLSLEKQQQSQILLELQQQVEQLMKQSDTWVSFSQQIAPILLERCIACHNAKTSKGQYSVASFADVRGAGESGPAIVAGKSSDSILYQVVADHSMPPDSHPLTEQQIQLLKKWVDTGARLDAGVDPDADLFRIAPKPLHPAPPDHYPTAIPITALAISPSGDSLVTSGYHEVLIWSISQRKLLRRISNMAQRVYGIAFLKDGQQIVVASGTPGRVGEVSIFDFSDGRHLSTVLVSPDAITAMSLSSDQNKLAVGEVDGRITLFSLAGEQPEELVRIDDHSDWINGLNWSSDGRWLVTASRDKTSKIFDVATGGSIVTFAGHQQNVLAACFVQDQSHIVSLGEDKRLRKWRINDAKQVGLFQDIPNLPAAMFGIDANRLLISGASSESIILGTDEMQTETVFRVPTWPLYSAAASNDESVVYFGSHNGKIHAVPWKQGEQAVVEFLASP